MLMLPTTASWQRVPVWECVLRNGFFESPPVLCVFKSSGCEIVYSPLQCSCRRLTAPLGRIAAE
jgi:hypothetical protein